jgi:glycosyltransferase involved in cell wall biosynthesis
MPSYNYARFLRDAVDSVLGQSHAAFELLIIDNGSTDGSYEIAQEYEERDGRVRVLTHPGRENRGVNASLNLGLASAQGAYFGLLPADDAYLPDALARRADILDAATEASFVYGASQTLAEDGTPTGQVGGRSPEDMLGFDRTDDLLQALLFHDFVPGAALIARTALLNTIGGFEESVYFNDWYVAIRLLALAGCVFAEGDPVVGYRHHERHRAEWNRDADRPRRLELFRALWRYSASSGDRLEEPRVRALIALQRAVHAYRLGEAAEVREAIGDAFAADASLRDDERYISWWLHPCHGEWSLALDRETSRTFRRALASSSAPVEEVLSAGGDYTSFVSTAIEASAAATTPALRAAIGWTAAADQLEALGSKPRPRLVASLVARASRSPRLVRVRPFVKAVLVAAGVWPVAAAARGRASAGPSGN